MSETYTPVAIHSDGTRCDKATTTRDCPEHHDYVEQGWEPCGWRCGDHSTGHSHYAVLIREGGKLLGRLTPDGTATNRKIFAAVMSYDRATTIAQGINWGGVFTAKVIPF